MGGGHVLNDQKLATTIMRIVSTAARKTYPKITTSDECVRDIRKEIRARILNPAIVSESEGKMV